MYKETLHASAPNKNLNNPEIEDDRGRSKVNGICDAFLKVLHFHAPTRYQNIITAHVCRLPPDLDAGLSEVARIQSKFSLKGLLSGYSGKPEQSPEEAEKMVEHICFLADVNKLYDNALGLYDLDLTLLVAQQSQKVFPHPDFFFHHSPCYYRTLVNIFPFYRTFKKCRSLGDSFPSTTILDATGKP